MVIADWFSGLDGHWLTPEWLVREHAILYSFSYLAVASFLIMTVQTRLCTRFPIPSTRAPMGNHIHTFVSLSNHDHVRDRTPNPAILLGAQAQMEGVTP